MEVMDTIEQARRELDAGHGKAAARLLTDAAYRTHDPELERQIRALAFEGRAGAGLLGKGRWEEIIRVAELRGGNGSGNGSA
jgi:hypothetical protein